MKTVESLIIIICFSLVGLVTAVAQEPNDSTSVQLDEIVVEADRQFLLPEGVAYIPTSREKKTSQNAIDMLRRLGVAQLDIAPATYQVKTVNNQDVQFFINGVKDNPMNIWTMEVKRVEFLVSPKDPRFMGAQYVVNYIVEEYKYGGYTRLNTYESFNGYFENNSNLFSRFKYGDITYDINVGSQNNDAAKRESTTSIEKYSLLNNEGLPTKVERTETMNGTGGKDDKIPVIFRAMYNHGSLNASTSLTFSYNRSKKSYRGFVSFDDPTTLLQDDTGNLTFNSDSRRTRSWQWYTDAFYFFPSGWFLGYNGTFSWDFNNSDYRYENDLTGLIENLSKEKRFHTLIIFYVKKNFGNHQLFLNASGDYGNYKVNYAGTSPSADKIKSPDASLGLIYGYNISKFRINADVNLGYQWYDVNKTNDRHLSLAAHLQFLYTINSSNQLSFFSQYYTYSTFMGSELSESIIRMNDYLYITGNPDIDPTHNLRANISYSWLPKGKFSIFANGEISHDWNRLTQGYSLMDNGRALLRETLNSGSLTQLSLSVKGRARFFEDNLTINVTPEYTYQHATGINKGTVHNIRVKVDAAYYFGNFYVTVFYRTPDKKIDPMTGFVIRRSGYNQLNFGWGNGHWNIWGGVGNIFANGWRNLNQNYDSDIYKSERTVYNYAGHRQFILGASYTFGYGKKIDRSNEANAKADGTSSILSL